MIEEIIAAIARALSGEFGEGYTIYGETVEQSLQTPCFFVFCASEESRIQRPGRYRRDSLFAVQYLPKSREEPRSECESVAGRLFLCLELIWLADGPVRGVGMRSDIVDGVLHFFVSYNMFLTMPRKLPLMAILDTDVKTKKG